MQSTHHKFAACKWHAKLRRVIKSKALDNFFEDIKQHSNMDDPLSEEEDNIDYQAEDKNRSDEEVTGANLLVF